MWSRLLANPVDWQALLLALLPTLAIAWMSALLARRLASSTLHSFVGEAIPSSSPTGTDPAAAGVDRHLLGRRRDCCCFRRSN
jgi:hypothetical protein